MDKWEDSPEDFAWEALKDEGMTLEEYKMAEGQGDARAFAIKNWGWKRLEGLNVETWNITPQDIKVIVNGIYDAYQDKVNKTSEVFIHVYSNNKTHEVTLNALSQGRLVRNAEPNLTKMAIQKASNAALKNIDKPSSSYYDDWE